MMPIRKFDMSGHIFNPRPLHSIEAEIDGTKYKVGREKESIFITSALPMHQCNYPQVTQCTLVIVTLTYPSRASFGATLAGWGRIGPPLLSVFV